MPLVFASRYGEPDRSLEMLAASAAAEPLSPTTFGLSVHNAIGALIGIARGDRADATALSAGPATPLAALVEAAGLLADGAPEVLVVCYDAPLPAAYAAFADGPAAPWAWAWRVAAGGAGACRMRLRCTDAGGDADTPADLPVGLELQLALLSGRGTGSRCIDGRRWSWCRDA